MSKPRSGGPAVAEWSGWPTPAKTPRHRDKRRTRRAARQDESAEVTRRLRVVPELGWPVRDGGRAARAPQPAVWRGTSATVAGIYPWLVSAPLPAVGVPVGFDVFAATTFSVHPAQWVAGGITTNPNVMLTGHPGSGKSATLKTLAHRMAGIGVRTLVLGDVKGEYNALARHLGVTPVVLGPGSVHRLNPLDGGPLADRLPSDPTERAERVREVHRRRLILLRTLVTFRLGRPLSTAEEAAMDLALWRATGEDRGGKLPDPVVGQVLHELWGLDDDDAQALQLPGRARLLDEIREAGLALHNLLQGTLSGLFDGPTTAPLDWQAPIQTVDVSRLEGRGDDALALVLSCLSSWGQAAVDDPGRGRDEAPRMVIRDELWRALRVSALVAKVDADLRLSRAQGTIQLLCTHRLADFEAAADPTVATRLVASCDVRVLMAQDLGEVRRIGDEIGLSEAEREMVSGWNASHIGRGLWRVGRGRSYVVQGQLTPLERELFHTNERMV